VTEGARRSADRRALSFSDREMPIGIRVRA